MAEHEDDLDYYALLGVAPDATLAQIKTAYRKESLKVHPDRNPDNPQAAHLFHQLNSAFTLLSDPSQRAALDTKLAALNARKQRFAALDNKRKALAQDLEEREREFKKRRGEEGQERRKKEGELERLKEEGRRLREERMKAASSAAAAAATAAASMTEAAGANGAAAAAAAGAPDDLGPLDKTLKIKWLRSAHPALTSPESVSALLSSLLAPSHASIDSVVISSKTLAALSQPPSSSDAKAKKQKHGSGVVAFRSLSAAVRAMKGKKGDREGRWEGVELDWAGGEVPEVVRGEMEAFERGLGGAANGGAVKGARQPPSFASAPPPPPAAASASFTTAPALAAAAAPLSEDSILSALRAREKERERLMEEMRREDEADEAGGP
ncbi:hypothetical protein JCM6882_006052 [Rhodosporidiobolus microsporus]